MAVTEISTQVNTQQDELANVQHLVNDGFLDHKDIAPLRPSSPSEPLETLRQRFEDDGYLFLKGLLPREDVLSCRESYFSHLSPSGVLKPGTEPVEGIYDADNDTADYPNIGAGKLDDCRPTAAMFLDLAEKAHKEPWYLEFSNHPDLQKFVEDFSTWGKNTYQLPRSLLRNNTPANNAIGVHYDQIFLRSGDPSALTAWIPIGDISITGGGLIYLEKSNDLGTTTEQGFKDEAKQGGMSDAEQHDPFNVNMMSTGHLAFGPREFGKEQNRRWLVTAYEAGDVVLHKPHMIHASTINSDPSNRIRLGTDLRFVDTRRQVDQRWLNPFHFNDGL